MTAADGSLDRPGHPARIGLADLRRALAGWRVWTTLAWNDIARRYRRSGLGQFWLTLSMAVTVFGLGFVYSTLFRTDVTLFLPYVAITFVVWGFISSTVTEGCSAFIEGEGLIKHAEVPRASHMLRVVTRTAISAAHNCVIIPCVFLFFGHAVTWDVLWLVLTVPLLALNLIWMGLVVAIVSARFRDVPQIVASVFQVLFFITPVMFKPAQLLDHAGWIIQWNPFANLLAIVRDPLLGQAPEVWALGYVIVLLIAGWALVLPFLGRYGPRVVYWL